MQFVQKGLPLSVTSTISVAAYKNQDILSAFKPKRKYAWRPEPVPFPVSLQAKGCYPSVRKGVLLAAGSRLHLGSTSPRFKYTPLQIWRSALIQHLPDHASTTSPPLLAGEAPIPIKSEIFDGLHNGSSFCRPPLRASVSLTLAKCTSCSSQIQRSLTVRLGFGDEMRHFEELKVCSDLQRCRSGEGHARISWLHRSLQHDLHVEECSPLPTI